MNMSALPVIPFQQIGLGVLFLVIALPLLRGKIKRNSWYGFRFKKSFASEELWLKINRFGARKLCHGAIFLIVSGSLMFAFPSSWQAICFPLFLLGVVLFVTVSTYLYTRSL
jgi:hypothetical protein